ncbi:MAG: YgfZ/GcvT domain-containing protein [Gemmatimonadales bacterium]
MAELDLTLERGRLEDVRYGATVVLTEPAVFRVAGPGSLTCLQGLLTNDLVKPGDGSLVYGALLTPKGMIVVDAWTFRQGDALTLVIPRLGHDAALALFQRALAARPAKVPHLPGEAEAGWLLGAHGFQTLAQSGVGMPEAAGRTVSVGGDLSPVLVGLAPESAPFVAVAVGLAPAVGGVADQLRNAGAKTGDETDLHAARILSGWPALGLEIDERTLPQEVRYDEIGGVSYTKGCYTGQETVARLHFRGHTNRELRGVRWNGLQPVEGRTVIAAGKEVGSVRSTLTTDGRTLGLALIRREIAPGHEVIVGGRQAVVASLPFSGDDLDG